MRPTLVLALAVTLAACGASPHAHEVGEVTWHGKLAPLVMQKCAGCHQQGGIAPFALDSYERAKPLASAMAAATESKRMPPWMPAADCNTFRDDRSLTETEIELFHAWVEQGTPEGVATGPAPAPAAGEGLSSVDVELTADAYKPSLSEPDDFHCFVVDPALTESKNLVAYELVPGSRKMAHHTLIYAVPRAVALGHDADDPAPGWACSTGSSANEGTLIGGYVPGTRAVLFPAGTGLPVGPGDAIVIEMHYNLGNGVETDTTRLQLQFATAPVKVARMLSLSETTFSVPPHSMEYTPPVFPKTTVIPFSGKVWGALPHMHRRGTKFRYEIRSGSTDTCLLSIDRWDYNWQEQFMFAEPITVTKGSTARLSCTWSNELDKPLVWGEGTDAEMCVSFAYVTID